MFEREEQMLPIVRKYIARMYANDYVHFPVPSQKYTRDVVESRMWPLSVNCDRI